MRHVTVDYHNGAAREEFAQQVRDALLSSKVVVTTGVRPDADPRGFWDEVSETIGDCVLLAEDPTGTKLGQKWMEIRYDASIPNAYRHSSGAQPMHTDGSYISDAPEIIFFYCVQQAPSGGATTFLDSLELLEILDNEDPGLLADLRAVPVRFAKAEDHKSRPIVAEDAYGPTLAWNYHCVHPDERPEVRQLAERFHRFLQERIVAPRRTLPVLLRPGEAVFFHDERLLHGRNGFEANTTNDRFLWKTGLRFTGSAARPLTFASG